MVATIGNAFVHLEAVGFIAITPPAADGCAWPIDTACLPASWDTLPAELQNRSVALASNTLRRLTGYRVGGCPMTVRPCKASNCSGFRQYNGYAFGSSFVPSLLAGQWINTCGCKTTCKCTIACAVALPGPVGAVYEVKVDGVVQDPTTYLLDGSRLLWQGEGECPWPNTQDLSLPDTEVGTFSITYLNSYPVDGLGAYAAGVLAAEYAKACSGDRKCRLPSGVTSIVRAGVAYEVASGAFPHGFTGINEVDAYLSLWNPRAMRQQTQVWTPDMGVGVNR